MHPLCTVILKSNAPLNHYHICLLILCNILRLFNDLSFILIWFNVYFFVYYSNATVTNSGIPLSSLPPPFPPNQLPDYRSTPPDQHQLDHVKIIPNWLILKLIFLYFSIAIFPVTAIYKPYESWTTPTQWSMPKSGCTNSTSRLHGRWHNISHFISSQ